jgi:hypothetical protein
MLTPQTLTILSDYKNWPSWPLTGHSSEGLRVTSYWLQDFVNVYAVSKQITDPNLKAKISHSMNDLIKNRYAEGLIVNQNFTAEAILTDIGKLVVKYVE